MSTKPCGRSFGSGTFSEQRGGGDHDDRLLGALRRVGQRVERGDAQADEVRRRRQMRLVGDAAARVVADRARRQPGAQVGGEIARGAIVADDDQRGALGVLVGERGDDERAQREADERGPALVGEADGRRIVFEVVRKARSNPSTLERAIVSVVLTKTVFEILGEPVTWAELAGFVTGIACVALAVAQRIETFPIGIANNVFFIVLFADARLFADTALQVVYIALGVMGWWVWCERGAREPRRRSRARRCALLADDDGGGDRGDADPGPGPARGTWRGAGVGRADDVDVARRAAAAQPEAAGDLVRVDRRRRDLRAAVLLAAT